MTILQKVAEPGVFSSYLGHAYYTLGPALQGQGKSEEARAAFRSAVEHLQATLGPGHPDTRSARRLERPKLSTNSLTSRFLPPVVVFSLPFPIISSRDQIGLTLRGHQISSVERCGETWGDVFEDTWKCAIQVNS